MNDFRKLTRIILVGLAIHILINGGLALFLTVAYLHFADSPIASSDKLAIVHPIFLISYAALVIYVLFYKTDWCTERIVGGKEPPGPQVWWLPVAFRLACVFSGILYLYWVIPSVISSLRAHLFARNHVVDTGFPALTPDRILSWVVLLALGIYLLCGAPHFVRWQVKKTLKQCSKSPAPEKQSSEEAAKEC